MACRLHHHAEYLIRNQPAQEKTDHEQQLQDMKRHYGPGLFKCIFPSCHMSRQGFTSAKTRGEHVKNHSRPWRCTMPDCEFAIIGFNSQNALMRHISKCKSVIHQPFFLAESITAEELEVLLFEAIRQKNIYQLRRLLSSAATENLINSQQSSDYEFGQNVAACAARSGSIAMVELVLGHLKEKPPVKAIVQSENVDLFKWLLKRVSYKFEDNNGTPLLGCSLWYVDMAVLVLQTENSELYCQWEDYMFTTEFEGRRKKRIYAMEEDLLPEFEKTTILFSSEAIAAVKANPFLEIRLTKTWQRLAKQGTLSRRVLGHALKHVVQKGSYSITLGRSLLELGASVDFPAHGSLDKSRDTMKRPAGKTVLHTAASSKSSFAAAKFMEFLIQNKANPIQEHAGRIPGEEKGALEIHNHLGVTWDELIARNLEDSDIERWAEQSGHCKADRKKRLGENIDRLRLAMMRKREKLDEH